VSADGCNHKRCKQLNAKARRPTASCVWPSLARTRTRENPGDAPQPASVGQAARTNRPSPILAARVPIRGHDPEGTRRLGAATPPRFLPRPVAVFFLLHQTSGIWPSLARTREAPGGARPGRRTWARLLATAALPEALARPPDRPRAALPESRRLLWPALDARLLRPCPPAAARLPWRPRAPFRVWPSSTNSQQG